MEQKKQYLSECAGIGPCTDVKSYKGRIYAIQRICDEHGGKLVVLTPELSVCASYEGIGTARQIEIVNDTAFITAREDGLWIFDVSNTEPKLLCHYQTVEYATGIALYGNLAFISCRQYGVQIIDISDPKEPKHISIVRVGEVQSATVSDNILYCGVWGTKEVVIVDVSEPQYPRVLTKIPLQGRGDGVCVRGNILYAATGQHGRGIVNLHDKDDPAYGMGNGLEVFDVSDPSAPKRINGILFEKGYCMTIDMWEAAFYGDTLVVNDTILGVYGLDPDTLDIKFRFLPPLAEPLNAVTGVTGVGKDLFVATNVDLFAARGLEIGDQEENRGDIYIETSKTPFAVSGEGAELSVKYSGSFPVLCAVETERAIALACVEGGVHLLDKDTLELRSVIKTKGLAQTIRIFGNRLYVAEGEDGVEIFDLDGFEAELVGIIHDQKNIYQLSISNSGRFLMCSLSGMGLGVFDVSDPKDPQKLYSTSTKIGLLYGNNFALHNLSDGTMLLFCHVDGLIYTNPDKGDREFHTVEYFNVATNRFCGYCAGEGIDTDGENIFYSYSDRYFLLDTDRQGVTDVMAMPQQKIAPKFRGLISLNDNLMVTCVRPTGVIWALDISDVNAPCVLARLETTASPERALFVGGRMFIPGGRDGLLEMKLDIK